ncbi:MAG: hypothetical protein FWF01_03665 [Alphaproteobacteria bacterium]|nr:hypothetical protein [Alphaproteobacteria bacterium]
MKKLLLPMTLIVLLAWTAEALAGGGHVHRRQWSYPTGLHHNNAHHHSSSLSGSRGSTNMHHHNNWVVPNNNQQVNNGGCANCNCVSARSTAGTFDTRASAHRLY